MFVVCARSYMFQRVNTTYGYTINIGVFAGGLKKLIVSKRNGIFFLKVTKGSLGVTLCRQYERDVETQRSRSKGKSWGKLLTVYFVGEGGCTLLEESQALVFGFSDRSNLNMKILHWFEVMS